MTGDGTVVEERTGPSPGIVRALFTLAGVAAAGFLLWLAQLWDLDETSGFWIAMAIVAGAGVALGLSQLFGGWTKWGVPTMSPTVFLLGFLPTLVLGGLILLARQPEGGWQQERVSGWVDDLGVNGFVDAMVPFLPVIALVIGLVFAFSFDTTGPRTQVVDRDYGRRTVDDDDDVSYRRDDDLSYRRDDDVATTRTRTVDEDVHDYRDEDVTTTRSTSDDATVAERLRERDEDTATTGATRVDRNDRI